MEPLLPSGLTVVGVLRAVISGLGNVQSASALREHIALYKTKLEFVQEKVEELQKDLAAKIEEADQYKEQLARLSISSEYAEESGALFKRLPSGGYSDTPICPACHSAMYSIGGPIPYTCGKDSCGIRAGFSKAKLQSIMARLPPK